MAIQADTIEILIIQLPFINSYINRYINVFNDDRL